jgi:plastocyanin
MKHIGSAVLITMITCTLFTKICVAQEHLVTQKNLKFDPIIKVVKPGDSIKFQNNDNVTHNIISLTEDFKFDLGEFKPGMTKNVKFKEKGVVDVQCTIHPEMKMTIFVF